MKASKGKKADLDKRDVLCDKIQMYKEEGEYDKALAAASLLSEEYSDNDSLCLSWYAKGLILYDMSMANLKIRMEDDALYDRVRYAEMAGMYFDKVLELAKNDDMIVEAVLLKKVMMENDREKARLYCLKSLGSDDEEIREEAYENYNHLTDMLFDDFEKYKTNPLKDVNWKKKLKSKALTTEDIIDFYKSKKFTSMNYEQRKFMLIVGQIEDVAGCYDESSFIRWIFALNRIPSDIQFPLYHPLLGTLYVAHPLKPTYYLPYNEALERMFVERVREFCHISKSLGATRITIRSLKGAGVPERIMDTGDDDYDDLMMDGLHAEKECTKQFSPDADPFCPQDIVWLDVDDEWCTMVEQRIGENVQHCEQKISVFDTLSLMEDRVDVVHAHLSNFIDSLDDKEQKEMEWLVQVDFDGSDSVTLQVNKEGAKHPKRKSENVAVDGKPKKGVDSKELYFLRRLDGSSEVN
jgi:tetratricopeptide (TPR) repeat protein